jgi:hypothetical protein
MDDKILLPRIASLKVYLTAGKISYGESEKISEEAL